MIEQANRQASYHNPYEQQAFQDQELQKRFAQQQKNIELRAALKAGTVRFSPDQKTQQAQLTKSRAMVQTDPRFNDDQRAQALQAIDTQYENIQPGPVPLDEQPPTPQQQFEQNNPTVTTADGYKVQTFQDRNGGTKEFVPEEKKSHLETQKALAVDAQKEQLRQQEAADKKAEEVEKEHQAIAKEAASATAYKDPATGRMIQGSADDIQQYIRNHYYGMEASKRALNPSPAELQYQQYQHQQAPPGLNYPGSPEPSGIDNNGEWIGRAPVAAQDMNPDSTANWNKYGPTTTLGSVPNGYGQMYANAAGQLGDEANQAIQPLQQMAEQATDPPQQQLPTPPQQAPVPVQSTADIKRLRLPPGTRIMTPDGAIRTVK